MLDWAVDRALTRARPQPGARSPRPPSTRPRCSLLGTLTNRRGQVVLRSHRRDDVPRPDRPRPSSSRTCPSCWSASGCAPARSNTGAVLGPRRLTRRSSPPRWHEMQALHEHAEAQPGRSPQRAAQARPPAASTHGAARPRRSPQRLAPAQASAGAPPHRRARAIRPTCSSRTLAARPDPMVRVLLVIVPDGMPHEQVRLDRRRQRAASPSTGSPSSSRASCQAAKRRNAGRSGRSAARPRRVPVSPRWRVALTARARARSASRATTEGLQTWHAERREAPLGFSGDEIGVVHGERGGQETTVPAVTVASAEPARRRARACWPRRAQRRGPARRRRGRRSPRCAPASSTPGPSTRVTADGRSPQLFVAEDAAGAACWYRRPVAAARRAGALGRGPVARRRPRHCSASATTPAPAASWRRSPRCVSADSPRPDADGTRGGRRARGLGQAHRRRLQGPARRRPRCPSRSSPTRW